jgi:hypothetical protein
MAIRTVSLSAFELGGVSTGFIEHLSWFTSAVGSSTALTSGEYPLFADRKRATHFSSNHHAALLTGDLIPHPAGKSRWSVTHAPLPQPHERREKHNPNGARRMLPGPNTKLPECAEPHLIRAVLPQTVGSRFCGGGLVVSPSIDTHRKNNSRPLAQACGLQTSRLEVRDDQPCLSHS